MVSKVKLYSRLDALEAELQEKVIPLLEQASKDDESLIFCVKDFNPFPELHSKVNNETEALISLGRQILSLQSKLGESSQTSIAARLCWYCREWADLGKPYVKHTQNLAKQFLEEIEK